MKRCQALTPLTAALVISAITLATAQSRAGDTLHVETPSEVEEIYIFLS